MDEKILDLLVSVCGVEDIKEDRDIDLFEAGLLDSLGVIEFLIEVEEQLHIKLEPTEVDREDIKTPNMIINYLSLRMAE